MLKVSASSLQFFPPLSFSFISLHLSSSESSRLVCLLLLSAISFLSLCQRWALRKIVRKFRKLRKLRKLRNCAICVAHYAFFFRSCAICVALYACFFSACAICVALYAFFFSACAICVCESVNLIFVAL